MKQKIRKGDTVEVISGRSEDKKKRGEVIRVIPAESRVVVQGINIRTKSQGKENAGNRNVSSGFVKFEAPIHVSNVMLVCPKCNAATRVGFSRDANGKVVRICKKCKAEIDA